MKEPFIEFLLYAVCPLLVAVAWDWRAAAADAAPAVVPREGRVSWDSPRIRAIVEGCLKAPVPAGMEPRSQYSWRMEQLKDRLSNDLSQAELRELAASFATMPVAHAREDETAHDLLSTVLDVLVHHRERDALVTLLSVQCPTRIYSYCDIEYLLAAGGKRLRDPIVILGEAYAKCRVPEVRANIAAVVRRAFLGSGIRGKNDDEVVANAMRWYEENKARLQVDQDYGRNTHDLGQLGDYAHHPLFKKRPPGMSIASPPAGTPNAWESPKLGAVERAYRKVRAPEGIENERRLDWRVEQLAGLVRKHVAARDMPELIASCGSMPVLAEEREGFPDHLLLAIVSILLDSGDRDNLVRLLSVRCPSTSRGVAGEVELRLVEKPHKVRNAVLVLGEAHDRCKLPEVRAEIAAAVRRGFSSLGVMGKDDAEFVKRSMAWYEQNKDGVTFNPKYRESAARRGRAEVPLFISKAASDN
jgi:hypothetical protein